MDPLAPQNPPTRVGASWPSPSSIRPSDDSDGLLAPQRAGSGGRRYGWRDAVLGVYVVLCLLANTWPGYARFGNSIEPYVLGVPFSLAWIVGWVLLTFVVLALYHVTGEEEPS